MWKSRKKTTNGQHVDAVELPVNNRFDNSVENSIEETIDEEESLNGVTQPQELPDTVGPRLKAIKDEVHNEVISQMDLSSVSALGEEELRFKIRFHSEMILEERYSELTATERETIVQEVLDETFGLGPLEPLFHDPAITDIMINGADTVYVERHGRLSLTSVRFNNDNHVIRIIQRIVGAMGRRIDETSPMVDGRLPDGSRINAIIPPLAIDGPLVSIRRFGSRPLKASNLLEMNSVRPEMMTFLEACVRGRLNVLISGGTGSGKTTLLNILSGYIGEDERVATIEDAAELQLQQPHVIRMETRPANVEGEGLVTTRDLVRNALRMRPDRVIVGECRGAEAMDMLQAMNTGHDGSLTTIHANTPRDAMMRLEMMVGMTGLEIPIWTIRRQIASAIHIVVQAARLSGGVRRITRISEVTGMEGDVLTMHDIFEFQQTGIDENRVAQGGFVATGVCPRCLDKLHCAGETIPPSLFEPRVLE